MSKTLPIFIAAKNLGNIRYNSGNDWLGQKGDYKGFVKFDSYENGLRAMFKLLQTYSEKYKLDTISSLIPRYAPKEDGNDTLQYIENVEQWSGVPKNRVIKFGLPASKIEAKKVVKAMVMQETGEDVSDELLEEGYNRAYDPKNSALSSTNTKADEAKKASQSKKNEKISTVSLIVIVILAIYAFVKGGN